MNASAFKKIVGAATAAVVLSAGSVSAQQSWDCGAGRTPDAPATSNVICTLDEYGVFTISGEGLMHEFAMYMTGGMADYHYPWRIVDNHIVSVIVEEGVTSVGAEAFLGRNALTSVTISNSVHSIGAEAFGGCTNLTAITVSENNESLTSVDGVLFNKAQTTLIQYPAGKSGTYEIPQSVTNIVSGAFFNAAKLSAVTIPEGIRFIGNNTFYGCVGLTSIEIPNSVTTIGHNAFFGCSGITSITIPSGVTSIGHTAFRNAGLTSVVSLNPEPPLIQTTTFNFTDACVYVPSESVDNYKAAFVWENFCIKDIDEHVSIAEIAREVPQVEETVIVAPPITVRPAVELTVGPNPVDRANGVVNFYVTGATVQSGTLTIFDASGNFVRRFSVDNMDNNDNVENVNIVPRTIATWNLRDARGRLVSVGTYLVRGSVTTANGARERVSALVGVR